MFELKWQNHVYKHYDEALQYFKEQNIVGIFLQGSQNYDLEIPGSDVDTKLIVTPSFRDIALNRKPVSTTHVRENNEHIDFKDIRLYIDTFRKQNLNFLEILFTSYRLINPVYVKEWDKLIANREIIAHMNPYRAVKSMKGVALEKYHAMEHEYPSKVEILRQYGYDCKQLHHLLRVEEYLQRYINGEPYEDCLIPKDCEYLKAVKQNLYSLEEAREIAKKSIEHTVEIADKFCEVTQETVNPRAEDLLLDVEYNIMEISVRKELV